MATRTLIVSVFLLGVAGLAAQPTPPPGDVELQGEWDDVLNFSGAALVGDHLLIASDELGFLQVGKREDSRTLRFARVGSIRLVAQNNGEEVEADFEALARDGNDVYALGSHSARRPRADRPKAKMAANRERLERTEASPERDVIFRFAVDARSGQPTGIAQASLRPAMQAHRALEPFTRLAGKENGVDLEGLASVNGRLYAGFRGPVFRHGYVPVLQFTFDSLPKSTLLYVPLDGRGIRDMAGVRDGALILAGPMGDGDTSHRVYWWNGLDCMAGVGGPGASLRYLAEMPRQGAGKAEALLVLDETDAGYRVVVFHDSLDRGAPVEMQVPREPAADTDATRLCGQSAS